MLPRTSAVDAVTVSLTLVLACLHCADCATACKSNSTVTYVSCGNYCVLPGTTCVSGIPQSARRRHLSRNSLNRWVMFMITDPHAKAHHRCSFGYEACRVPGTPRQSLVFECLDTANDLESCEFFSHNDGFALPPNG